MMSSAVSGNEALVELGVQTVLSLLFAILRQGWQQRGDKNLPLCFLNSMMLIKSCWFSDINKYIRWLLLNICTYGYHST